MVVYDTVTVSIKDYNAWIELMEANIYCTPWEESSKMKATLKLSNGVKVDFAAYALEKVGEGYYFAKSYESATHVRVATYFGNAFSLSGKGSRSTDTWKQAQEALDLLTGVSGGY